MRVLTTLSLWSFPAVVDKTCIDIHSDLHRHIWTLRYGQGNTYLHLQSEDVCRFLFTHVSSLPIIIEGRTDIYPAYYESEIIGVLSGPNEIRT